MKPSKKLYEVRILLIEEGVEYRHQDSKNVVAEDAISASKKVRLVKTKKKQTFIESIIKLNDIDKF